MARRLPPLNGLRAFEAAARHLSFRAAAEDLHVTPAAISQQIRALKEHCGTPLFRRLARALELTEAGRAAAPLLREGFDRLADAVARMRPAPDTPLLTVSVAPSFAAKWLVLRLDRFRVRHPEYDVRIDATDALARFGGDGVDIALRYGRGVYGDLRSDCLMSDVSAPVYNSHGEAVAGLSVSGPARATDFGYYLVYPAAGADAPKVAAFRAWVLDEVARDTAEAACL